MDDYFFSVDYQYKHFKATIPERRVTVGVNSQYSWRFYESGPRDAAVILCLGGVAATAEVFYKQLLAVASKGYRVVAADPPVCSSHEEWIRASDLFLDALNVYQVHMYGSSFGGFLCQSYAYQRPRRVLSLVLSNSFFDTHKFHAALGPWVPLLAWAPDFVLKRLVLSGLRDGPHEPLIADSIDFVVSHLDLLPRSTLASRLQLNTQPVVLPPLQHLSEDKITIMDTNDFAAVPLELREAVFQRYPGARKALLKSGGDFPFLSRPDEVNLHLLLHLRRCGATVGQEFQEAEQRRVEQKWEDVEDRWKSLAGRGLVLPPHSRERTQGSKDQEDENHAAPISGSVPCSLTDPLGGSVMPGIEVGSGAHEPTFMPLGSSDPLSGGGFVSGSREPGHSATQMNLYHPPSPAKADNVATTTGQSSHPGDKEGHDELEGVADEEITAGHEPRGDQEWSAEHESFAEQEEYAWNSIGDNALSSEGDFMPMPGIVTNEMKFPARQWLAMVEGEHYHEAVQQHDSALGIQERKDDASHPVNLGHDVVEHLRVEESPLG